jgi:methylated-DNA-[protein]-cysteine S-methyltransferase
MMATGFALFETAIGTCAMAWGDGGIVGTALPEADAWRLRAQCVRRYQGAVEAAVPSALEPTVAEIQALLRGEAADFSAAPLDWSGVGEFERRVYDDCFLIVVGKTKTYGEIARGIGDVSLARAVGNALGRNPFPPIVPCHRVVAANGRTGGFSAPGGVATKFKLLEIERAHTAPADLFGGLAFKPRR